MFSAGYPERNQRCKKLKGICYGTIKKIGKFKLNYVKYTPIIDNE